MYAKTLNMINKQSRFQLKVKFINTSVFPLMISVPTYGHQQHIIWNTFNKCLKIHVEIKDEKLNDDNL